MYKRQIEAVAAIDNPTDFTDDDLTLDMSLDMEAAVEEYAGPVSYTHLKMAVTLWRKSCSTGFSLPAI